MPQKENNLVDNIPGEKKSSFLSLTEEQRDALLKRNREARRREHEAFIEAYFASDMRYNIK